MIPGKLLIENTLKRCCEDDSIVRMNAISEVNRPGFIGDSFV
jgi:hypothetical protein